MEYITNEDLAVLSLGPGPQNEEYPNTLLRLQVTYEEAQVLLRLFWPEEVQEEESS